MTAPASSPPSAGPSGFADLRSRVQDVLDRFMSRQASLLGAVSEDLVPLADSGWRLLSGGKRLRPAFCYWAWRGASGPDCDEIVAAAAALELFQGAALVHDDVMDGSDTRRGRPSVHRQFATRHQNLGYSGNPEQFGEAAAILLGDLLLSWSDELLMRSGLPDAALHRGRAVFDVMRTQLMGGQFLDMLGQALPAEQGGGTVDRARTVIRYKSAKYSVEHPLLLGGALANADEDLMAGYSSYGLALGEAFQLRDDLLGVFGDPAETGKPAGDDLREGKRTVLVATALQSASAAQAATVERLLGKKDLDSDGVSELRGILVDTGALDAVEQQIDALSEHAYAAVRSLALPSGADAALRELVVLATSRSV